MIQRFPKQYKLLSPIISFDHSAVIISVSRFGRIFGRLGQYFPLTFTNAGRDLVMQVVGVDPEGEPDSPDVARRRGKGDRVGVVVAPLEPLSVRAGGTAQAHRPVDQVEDGE